MFKSTSEIDELLHNLGFTRGAASPTGPATSQEWQSAEPGGGEGASADVAGALDQPTVETTEPLSSPPALGRPGASGSKSESTRCHLFQQTGRFFPLAPETLDDAGLSASEISDLMLKFLAIRGVESGFNIARQMGMKFPLIESLLRQLKIDRLVAYKTSAAGGDYLYELTSNGRERARTLAEQCTYIGTAPVPLKHYIEGVKAQSLVGRRPTLDAIRAAFSDLAVNDDILSSIGQAIHSGRGMFLFGPSGNGKTSMAERVTKAFGDTIWIPRCVTATGEILRLFDPNRHKPVPFSGSDAEHLDGRWIQIERPTIIAGGELMMSNLEITYIRRTGVGEAPLQMKANCGTLLIDDLGRQRMSIDELLNRWIVPLEQRHDYLHLESGRTIQVPFDQLIIFSSNLEPRDLVDEAFLRRIPYKIEVRNPTEAEFQKLFLSLAHQLQFECEPGVVDELIRVHFIEANRQLRFCHPRDLLRQIENRCTLHNLPHQVTREGLDQAVRNYFAIM